jgi:tyrosine-protein phosphatase SIW14
MFHSPRGLTRCLTLVALLSVAPQLAAAEPAPAPPQAAPVRLNNVEGVSYAAEVEPGLLRGSRPSAAGVAWLKRQGVKTVINLRRFHYQTERAQVEAAGMRFEHIPLEASDAPSDAQISRFMALATDASLRPIYVHCAQGVDRTGTMVAVYRMERQGLSNADALAEMMNYGAHAIWLDLRRFVRTYRPRGNWRALSSDRATTP